LKEKHVLTWLASLHVPVLKAGKLTQPLLAMNASLVSMTVTLMPAVLTKKKDSAVNATLVIPMHSKALTEPTVNKMATGHHFV